MRKHMLHVYAKSYAYINGCTGGRFGLEKSDAMLLSENVVIFITFEVTYVIISELSQFTHLKS